MKKLIILSAFALISFSGESQVKFEEFVKRFKPLNLPQKDILNSQDNDTISGKRANDILIRSKKQSPKYIDKNGNPQVVKQYYGLYPEKPFDYLIHEKNAKGEWEEKKLYFSTKVIPVGRLNLDSNHISLVIKVVDYETTFMTYGILRKMEKRYRWFVYFGE